MSFIEKNISYLEKNPFNKNAVSKIKNFQTNTASLYSLSKTKDSDISLLYDNKYITSSLNPKTEAKRFIESIAKEKHKNYNALFLSIASMHHIEYFAKEYEYKNIIIIEKDISLIRLILSEKDFPFLLNAVFLADENENCIKRAADEIIEDADIKNTAVFLHPRASLLNKTYYDNIAENISLLARKKIMSLATYYYSMPLWSKNILYNSVMNKAFCLKGCLGMLSSKVPILLIGGGASVDAYWDEVKELEKTHFILALSNSLIGLLENGIYPDSVISTDGGFYSSAHLTVLRYAEEKNIMIFTAHSAYPYPFYNLDKENIFYFSQNESFEKYLYKDSLSFPMEGSVLNTAYRIGEALCPSHIVLAGCDFSYTDEKTHSRHSMSYYSDYKNQNKIKTLYCFNQIRQNAGEERILDYENKEHRTSKALSEYYRHFENIVSNSSVKTFTLTKESARIEKVQIYKIDKSISRKKYSFEKQKEKIHENEVREGLKEYGILLKNKNIEKLLSHEYSFFIAPWQKEKALENKNAENDFIVFAEKWMKDISFFYAL